MGIFVNSKSTFFKLIYCTQRRLNTEAPNVSCVVLVTQLANLPTLRNT